jgi:hypothetical protein
VEIEWRDPPENKPKQGRNAGSVKALVEELKKHPGKWAAVRSEPKSDVKKLNSPSSYLRYKYKVEVTVRIEDDEKTVTLFARWPAKRKYTRRFNYEEKQYQAGK